jgi:hypothetical protein
MNKKGLVYLLLLLMLVRPIVAPAGVSSTFVGSVTIDGLNVSQGSIVISTCNSGNFANATVNSNSNYYLNVPNWAADAPDGCNNGDAITFQVKIGEVTINASEDSIFNNTPDFITLDLTLTDATEPSAPTSLSATETSAGSINLSWTAATDDVGVQKYLIYRSTTTGLTTSTGTNIANATETDYLDVTGASNGETYYYIVSAMDSVNEGDASSEASESVTDSTAPSVPTSLTVIDEADAEESLFISWTAPGDLDVVNYTLYYSDDNTTWDLESTLTDLNYTDDSLTDGETYYYMIAAVDSSDNPSVNSSPAGAAPLDDLNPDQITGLAVVDITADENGLNLTWNAASGDGSGYATYMIYRNATNIANQSIGTLYYADTTAVDGTLYSYQVSVKDDAGNEGTKSVAVEETSLDDIKPTAPTVTIVSAGNGVINLDWDAITDAEEYDVYLSNETATYTTANDTTTDTNYTFTGLSVSTTYYMVVKAIDTDSGVASGYNSSVNSNEVSGTPSDRPTFTADTASGSYINNGTDLIFRIQSSLGLSDTYYKVYNSTELLETQTNTTSLETLNYTVNTSHWDNLQTFIVEIWANDSNAQEDAQNFTYVVDNNAPVVTLNSVNGLLENNNTPALNFTVTDEFDTAILCKLDVNGSYYAINSAVLNNTATLLTVNASLVDGDYDWNVKCWDLANNTNNHLIGTKAMTIDTTNPVTTSNNPSSWSTSAFTINFSASDINGVEYTNYTFDSVTYTADFVNITTEGNHTITFYSHDNAGNTETANTIYALLDLTAPVTTSDVANYSSWQGSDFNLTLSPTDATSLVNGTNYSVDGTPGTGTTVEITTSGNHTVTYLSYDNAGNTESLNTIYASLDKVDPIVNSLVLSSIYSQAGDTINLTTNASDNLSGIASCYAYFSEDTTYDVNDTELVNLGVDCNGSFEVPTSDDGLYYVIVRALDNVNNSGVATQNISVDTTAPVITINSPSALESFASSNATFNYSIVDAFSLVDSVWYTLDYSTTEIVLASATAEVNITSLDTGTHNVYLYANDSLGNERMGTVEFIINLPLNVTSELAEIVAGTTDTIETITLDINGTDVSTNESVLANQSLTLTMEVNSSNNNVTVIIPDFNGLDANWGELFDLEIDIDSVIANATGDNSGTLITAISVFTDADKFLPEEDFTYGARIVIDSPLGDFYVLFIEDDEGESTYRLDECSIVPTGTINTTNMCYVNTSLNVTLYLPHLSGGALVNDSIAPSINFTSPVNESEINDSFTTISVGFIEAYPQDDFCTYNMTKNGSDYDSGTIELTDVTWVGTEGSYEVNYSALLNDNYQYSLTCIDEKNQSTTDFLNFTINDSVAPTVDSLSVATTGTTSVVLTLTAVTNENATCRYSLTNDAYANMTGEFTTDDNLEHSDEISFSSDATGTYYVSCVDINSNTMGTSSTVNFEVDVTAAASSSSSGGFSVTGFTKTKYMLNDESKTFVLTTGDEVEFEAANELHSATIEEISLTKARLKIASNTFFVTINVNDTKYIDFDNDNVNDLAISLNEVNREVGYFRAYFTFEVLGSTDSDEDVINPDNDPKPVVDNDYVKKPGRRINEELITSARDHPWIFVLCALIMIGAAGYLYYVNKK